MVGAHLAYWLELLELLARALPPLVSLSAEAAQPAPDSLYPVPPLSTTIAVSRLQRFPYPE